MSDSNRGDRDPNLGQGLAIIAAVLLCATIVGIIAFSLGREAERSGYQAAHYQAEAKRDQDAICVGRTGPLLAECLAEQERAARSAYQSHQDLNAQRDMSLWAFAVFIIGAVTTGLTLWALWYVRGTLKETQRMAEQSIEATKAMTNANEISQTILRQDLRPYFFVDKIDIHTRTDFPKSDYDADHTVKDGMIIFRTCITIKNFGRIPARNIRIHTKSYLGRLEFGRFWDYTFGTDELPICAPSTKRDMLIYATIPEHIRSDFDHGVVSHILRMRYTYQDEMGREFTETSDHYMNGSDFGTYYLLLDKRVKHYRDQAKQLPFDYSFEPD